MERIKIKLRQTPEKDFRVTLDYREEQDGFLPAMPQALDESFRRWQATYRQLEEVRSYISLKSGTDSSQSNPQSGQAFAHRLSPKRVTRHSGYEYADEIKRHLNQWLNTEDSRWQQIREGLISIASEVNRNHTQIPVLLDVEDAQLRRLPWQEWSLLENYSAQAEVILRVKGHPGENIKPPQRRRKVRILVVVGRSDGIRTQDDLKVIQRLRARGAEVVSLIQPSVRELCEALWDKRGYHIFVFTGHSGSQPDGQIGWIEMNDQDSLSIEEFKHALKTAIDRGLQLAIFNSCDGLGLASQFAQLNLPRSIVMREPVPDEVAVDFLDYFFEAFTNNQSLIASVHTARKQLEYFSIPQVSKRFYPGVMWLPTICTRQSALEHPLTWRGLIREPFLSSSSLAAHALGIALGSAATLFGMFLFNPLQTPSEPDLSIDSTLETVNTISGKWRYGGSTTWAPIRGRVDAAIAQRFPEFNLIYSPHPTLPEGSGTGIRMLLDGQLSFSQSSRPVKDSEYEVAALRGFQLRQIAVAIDGIAIAVHPGLDIAGLTLDQLRGIYAGEIKNWKQVGGPNLEIVPYSRPTDSGTTEFFRDNVLGKSNFANTVVFIEETTLALQRINQFREPGGIYYATASEIVGQCSIKPLPISYHAGSAFVSPYQGELVPPENCPNQRNQLNYEALQNGEYPFTRRLFVIIKQNDQNDQKAGEAYADLLLTDEGQALIRKAGFLPIR